MKIGIIDYPLGAKGEKQPSGVIEIQRRRAFAIIDMETGETVDNIAAFLWGTGHALNARMDHGGETIRSWPKSEADLESEHPRLFDDRLDPEADYLLLAIPCPSFEREDDPPG